MWQGYWWKRRWFRCLSGGSWEEESGVSVSEGARLSQVIHSYLVRVGDVADGVGPVVAWGEFV